MQVRVYYEDTDAGGVVYHANYLAYFERARTEYLRSRGLSVRKLHEEGFIFPVVRVDVEFRAPARHDDLLNISTSVLEVGKTSFTLLQRAMLQGDGKFLVEARITLVCVSPGMKPRRIPQPLLAALENDDA